MSELAYKRTNVYEVADEKLMKAIFDYAEGYKTFIDEGKTEREACAFVEAAAKEKGYKPFTFGQKLQAGDKVYYNNRGKNMFLIRIGTEDVAKDGIRIIASHIDSPRIDLKQVPLYEKDNIAFAKTHYYGGIRKYQWATIPLALHGVVMLKNGEKLEVRIGEGEHDPERITQDEPHKHRSRGGADRHRRPFRPVDTVFHVASFLDLSVCLIFVFMYFSLHGERKVPKEAPFKRKPTVSLENSFP